MYYDDQAKRFNLVSGLMCGAVLGAGLALLLVPSRSRSPVERAGRAARKLRKRAARGLDGIRDGVGGLADGAARAGRKRFRL
ncbi:MAG TPA: hypothetical protein VFE05_23845 [Longimicrobiaceae bacterium]|jgi:hypothetical protein|nr:hypothetical protein [Longimicrobiaceae bacterium]